MTLQRCLSYTGFSCHPWACWVAGQSRGDHLIFLRLDFQSEIYWAPKVLKINIFSCSYLSNVMLFRSPISTVWLERKSTYFSLVVWTDGWSQGTRWFAWAPGRLRDIGPTWQESGVDLSEQNHQKLSQQASMHCCLLCFFGLHLARAHCVSPHKLGDRVQKGKLDKMSAWVGEGDN